MTDFHLKLDLWNFSSVCLKTPNDVWQILGQNVAIMAETPRLLGVAIVMLRQADRRERIGEAMQTESHIDLKSDSR